MLEVRLGIDIKIYKVVIDPLANNEIRRGFLSSGAAGTIPFRRSRRCVGGPDVSVNEMGPLCRQGQTRILSETVWAFREK